MIAEIVHVFCKTPNVKMLMVIIVIQQLSVETLVCFKLVISRSS